MLEVLYNLLSDSLPSGVCYMSVCFVTRTASCHVPMEVSDVITEVRRDGVCAGGSAPGQHGGNPARSATAQQGYSRHAL